MTVPQLTAPATFGFVEAPHRAASELVTGDALVRVRAGGICGSDLPFFRGRPVPDYAGAADAPAGYPLHEIVGELIAVGPGTATPAPLGTTVVGWATRFDGLADVVITDAASLAPSPVGLPDGDAVLIQPLACVLYAVERLGEVRGKRCAVLGLGPIGLLFTHVLKQRGAAAVIGVDRVDRSDVAGEFGIDEVHHETSESWARSAQSAPPDVVVEAVGHQVTTLRDALVAAAPSGTVFYFGVNDDAVYPLDMELLLRKNLTLMSGGTLDRQRMLLEAADYLARYPELIKASVTHRFERTDVQAAFDIAAVAAPGRLKVVINVVPDAS
jgi:threonine dehydrogenase-like Zn-dependent dehydrogenase